MKIAFFGTPDFACDSLKAVASTHDIVACITRPDRPAGRGKRITACDVSLLCSELGIVPIQPDTTEELTDAAMGINADAFVVVAFGVILPKMVIDRPLLGCFNLHASLLPKYRGAAPINWAIVRGETVTGVTVMRMVENMDAGPILAQKETAIQQNETAGELYSRLSVMGAKLLANTLNSIEAGTSAETPQNDDEATLAPSLRKANGCVDWNKTPKEISNFVRGMTPWPGAFTSLPVNDGKMQLILTETKSSSSGNTGTPGTIIAASDEGIEIACSEGTIQITRLKPAGKREMSAAEFLRGHSVI